MSLFIQSNEDEEYQEITVDICFLELTFPELRQLPLEKRQNAVNHCYVLVKEENHKIMLKVCNKSTPNASLLAHSPHCPLLLRDSIIPKENELTLLKQRGISIASCVLLERRTPGQPETTQVLITKRSNNLTAFPNVWVVPGGHTDEGESLVEGALREIKEEVGLDLLYILHDAPHRIHPIGIWESVFPSNIQNGFPRRHHFVQYFRVLLNDDESNLPLSLLPSEVELSGWIGRALAHSLVSQLYPETLLSRPFVDHDLLENGFFVGNSSESKSEMQLKVVNHLCGTDTSIGKERISTATLFVLSEWVRLFEDDDMK